MGKQMSVRELRAALSRIEHELAEHGEIELTRNGDVVARVTVPGNSDRRAYRDNPGFRETVTKPIESITDMLDDVRGSE